VPKPVLSNYPVSQDNMGSDAVPRICNASWMDSGLYRMDAAHDTWPKCARASSSLPFWSWTRQQLQYTQHHCRYSGFAGAEGKQLHCM
jgi:hypothetical protein